MLSPCTGGLSSGLPGTTLLRSALQHASELVPLADAKLTDISVGEVYSARRSLVVVGFQNKRGIVRAFGGRVSGGRGWVYEQRAETTLIPYAGRYHLRNRVYTPHYSGRPS